MRLLLTFLFTLLFSMPAFAGVRGYNGTTDLKVFDSVQCSSGLSCSRSAGKFVMVGGAPGARTTQTLATATTLTAAQCNSSFHNSGAIEIELPDADLVLGCRYTFITLNASNFHVDPDAADTIFGLTNAAGDRILNATLGNSVTLQAVATGWAAVGIYGTYTDAN